MRSERQPLQAIRFNVGDWRCLRQPLVSSAVFCLVPFDVVRTIEISRAALRKMHQNLFWAVAYNAAAFPLAAGVLYPIVLRPEVAALAMSGSTVLVALNGLLLKRFRIERRSAWDLSSATSPQSE